MKRMAVAVLVLALAACARGVQLPPPNTAQAHFEQQQQAVRVMISDVAPPISAELLAPNGSRYPAVALTILSAPYIAYNPPPTVGLSIGGFGFSGCCSSFGSGVGVGFPVGGPTPAAISDQYIASAVIPVPPDYAQHWANYRVQVQVGNRSLLLAAPAPLLG